MAIQAVHFEMEDILDGVGGNFDKLDAESEEIRLSYDKAWGELEEAYRKGQRGTSNFPTYEALMESLKKK